MRLNQLILTHILLRKSDHEIFVLIPQELIELGDRVGYHANAVLARDSVNKRTQKASLSTNSFYYARNLVWVWCGVKLVVVWFLI